MKEMTIVVKMKLPAIRGILVCLFLLIITQAHGAEAPGDIRFEREGDQSQIETFPPAWFPHWVHRVRYRCDTCHEALFKMQAGANKISMDLMKMGESCGACHNGGKAFDDGFENCARCHTSPAQE